MNGHEQKDVRQPQTKHQGMFEFVPSQGGDEIKLIQLKMGYSRTGGKDSERKPHVK